MPAFEFLTVDVFTTERFRGNPLAVFPDARGLASETMQAIAAEFGYSEITFVLPPEDPENHARVRIFTPTAEIPFAGHPNVGTAFILGRMPGIFGKPVRDHLRFEEKAGLVSVDLRRVDGSVTGATIRAPQPLTAGETVEPGLVARCASLDPALIALRAHPPRFVSVGLPFAVAELESEAALAAARPNLAVFHEALTRHRGTQPDFSLFLYVRDAGNPAKLRTRMFAPLDNVMEDPATGSASAALGAYLASLMPESDATIGFELEQGVEMGRRSLISLSVTKRGGQVTDIFISGDCVNVMRGTIATS